MALVTNESAFITLIIELLKVRVFVMMIGDISEDS